MSDAPAPARWLVDNVDLLPAGGRVLDVACGRGRHALWIAERGWDVHAVDRNPEALQSIEQQQREAPRAGRVSTERLDLETGRPSLGHRLYAAVLVFNYLHRPLLPVILDAVADGGVLIYETFTIGQAARGQPKNPAFLLQPGELTQLVAPLRVVRGREGDDDGRLVASVVAVRW